MSGHEKRLWRWAARVVLVAAMLGFLGAKAHLARVKAQREWEERYERKEWWEREGPNWYERTFLGIPR